MQMFTDIEPDRLVRAMITSGHLDEHPNHRLIVHDWDQHADYNTKRKVLRRNSQMHTLGGDVTPIVKRDASSSVTTGHNPTPEPEPEPEPEPIKDLALSSDELPAAAVFNLPLVDGTEYGVPRTLRGVLQVLPSCEGDGAARRDARLAHLESEEPQNARRYHTIHEQLAKESAEPGASGCFGGREATGWAVGGGRAGCRLPTPQDGRS